MRNLMKLIAITAMTALLLFALVTCAAADEKIYTSPVFKLPPERLTQAEEIIEAQAEAEEAEPEETDESEDAEGEPEEAEVPEDAEGEPEDDLTEDFDEGENLEDGEDFADLEDDAGELEPEAPQRQVIIKSSQGEIVTEGDQIVLTSELVGFGDEPVTYQWQVDRGDGQGWVDVEGATRYKHTFIANKETIQYSWRLIVNIEE